MKLRYLIGLLVSCICLALSGLALAEGDVEHYLFHYTHASTYDVKLTDNTVTWESISGDDKGTKETDELQRLKISNLDFLQWTENDGTFVTVVLDIDKHIVVSSGKYLSSTWLRSGTVESIP